MNFPNRHLILAAIFIVVYLQGRNLLKMLNLGGAIPNKSIADGVIHSVVFLSILYAYDMFGPKRAAMHGKNNGGSCGM